MNENIKHYHKKEYVENFLFCLSHLICLITLRFDSFISMDFFNKNHIYEIVIVWVGDQKIGQMLLNKFSCKMHKCIYFCLYLLLSQQTFKTYIKQLIKKHLKSISFSLKQRMCNQQLLKKEKYATFVPSSKAPAHISQKTVMLGQNKNGYVIV